MRLCPLSTCLKGQGLKKKKASPQVQCADLSYRSCALGGNSFVGSTCLASYGAFHGYRRTVYSRQQIFTQGAFDGSTEDRGRGEAGRAGPERRFLQGILRTEADLRAV